MMQSRILVAVDDSEPSARALQTGASLALALRAQLAVVHVVSTWPFSVSDSGHPAHILRAHCRQRSQAVLLQALSCVAHLRPKPLLREGKPADEILTAAAEWD